MWSPSKAGETVCATIRLPLSFLQAILVVVTAISGSASGAEILLPQKDKSVRFAVIGDSGTGGHGQYQVAEEMARCHQTFPFDFVIMLGDNIYGSKTPADFKLKFEEPYGKLLNSGVKFYASLGNHDHSSERLYKPFNMEGKRYYSFKKGNAMFLALDSNYMDPTQLEWIQQQLDGASATWKICYFHHPLYSDGRYHGPDLDLRRLLEPIFMKTGVQAVFNGHEHFYERLRPQNGIQYFVLGSSGELRPHNLRPSGETAKGFDTDRTFQLIEIDGNQLYFQTITRSGQTVDHGEIKAEKKP